MKITTETVRKLLDSFITPMFKDSIVDYKITVHDNDKGVTEGVNINVILDYESYEEMWYNGKDTEYETIEMEKSVRDVMKYLSAGFTIVEFYVDDKYIVTSPY
tara:strand:+ start:1157 stop:1465 length:309 start_codon:yes stop_codon:yes gene_type:complete